MATLGIPSNTIAVLQKYNFTFQKKFGQNFLIDTRVLEKIIDAAEVTKEDCVVEIGPGIGTMTQYLAERAGRVVAVEIDRALIPILEDTLSAYDNVEILNEDILKVDLNRLAEEKNGGRPVKVVANLPYYITTPIVMGLFESHVPLSSITIMVQKEVAERMCAQQGPQYGALSVAVQLVSEPCIKRIVGRSCFTPQPSVDSAIVRLDVMRRSGIKDFALLKKLVRAAFGMRRKTLANNLIASFGMQRGQAEELLRRAGFSAMIRGENVTVDGFIALSNILSEEGEH